MRTAIRNVSIFDGIEWKENGSVVFEDGIFVADNDADVEIDGSGCTLLPGLIDAHAHLYENKNFLKMAATHGVTTLLDMGIRNPEVVDSLRELEGLTSIKSSCGMIFAPGSGSCARMGYPGRMIIKDASDVERIVLEEIAYGADYIKVIIEQEGLQTGVDFPVEIGRSVVDCAHRNGKLTVCHSVTNKTFRSALNLGIDILSHIPYMEQIDPSIVDDLKKSDSAVVPTLIMGQSLMKRFAAVNPNFKMTIDLAVKNLAELYKAGVEVLVGTDSNMDDPLTVASVPYGEGFHEELLLFVSAGISPIETLRSATSRTAKRFGLNDRGMIAPGLRADLVLVKGNPIENIEDIRNIEKVWVKGNEVQE